MILTCTRVAAIAASSPILHILQLSAPCVRFTSTLPTPPPSPLPCSLADEVGIMASLDHVHLVRLAAFYEDAGAYYIVTELMTGACVGECRW